MVCKTNKGVGAFIYLTYKDDLYRETNLHEIRFR